MLLLIGGLDPTGGAGVLRDVMTARAFAPSLATRTLVSAWTQQGHGRPAAATFVGRAAWTRQLEAIPRPVSAVKVGLIPAAAVPGFCAWWDAQPNVGRLVVDPVLRASDGGRLGDVEGLGPLLDRAHLVTPNRAEAEALDLHDGALRRHAALLLKGGHDDDPTLVTDRLVTGVDTVTWARPRQPGPDVRGTGCALSTAIAASLAQGVALPEAVGLAIAWLDDARRRAIDVPPDGRFLP